MNAQSKKSNFELTCTSKLTLSCFNCVSIFFTDATSKTTIIVKFKGAIDIVITPVVLESAQRMFDSLTPTFQRLHPNSVVNHLHSQSLDRVESKNTLMKKEKSLDLQEKFLDTSGKDLQVKPLKWLLEPLCCTVLHEVL